MALTIPDFEARSPDWRARWGAWLWASSIQFFVLQGIVALGWPTPFDVTERYISDLGNTACAPYPAGSATLVCSPWHAAMNASFLLLGVTMAAGSILGAAAWRRGWLRIAGLGLIVLAGLGVLLVGLFPENEDIMRHSIGAGLNFLCGNGGMILLGAAGLEGRPAPGWNRFTTVMGAVGLAGTALFVSGRFLGIGAGGMERVAAYPLTVWLTVLGYRLARRSGRQGNG
jgi:hypothetical membrane protein